MPIGLVIAGANRPDMCLLGATLDGIVVPRPAHTGKRHCQVCLDAGYDAPVCYIAAAEREYVPHVRSRKAEHRERHENPEYQPRRWVVEVAHSWLNRFRKILVSFEKLETTRLALLQFACAYIVLHRTRLFTNRADVS
jgi:putative transposase